jgi:hypothetical protein
MVLPSTPPATPPPTTPTPDLVPSRRTSRTCSTTPVSTICAFRVWSAEYTCPERLGAHPAAINKIMPTAVNLENKFIIFIRRSSFDFSDQKNFPTQA